MDILLLSKISLFFLVLFCIAIVAWLYRPNRSTLYKECANIPLRDSDEISEGR